MGSRFIKTNETPYKRCDVEEYSNMDIDKFYSEALPKISRRTNEKWHRFKDRRYKAEDSLKTYVFGRFYRDTFELNSVPEEYSDYQYSIHSEFGHSPRNRMIGKVSISVDLDEVAKFLSGEQNDLKKTVRCTSSKPHYTQRLNKINLSNVGLPFSYRKIERFLLNNTVSYIKNNCDSDGCISVTRWLTGTGKSGRTKEIEYLSEGCNLLWSIKKNTWFTEISILSPNGTIIGEINWKSDDDYIDDDEFNEVYEPLLRNGCVAIDSIQLQSLIPHNTPKGRPRKALVQVLITLRVINLEENLELLERTKLDIQSMRTLAAIDYNRKCDIIEGKIPEKISSLKELFTDDEFVAEDVFATCNILRSGGFLSGYSLTAEELEEIWSIYMPLYTFSSLYEQSAPMLNEETARLFCKKRYFNYVIEYEQELKICGDESRYGNAIRLTLYRNEYSQK